MTQDTPAPYPQALPPDILKSREDQILNQIRALNANDRNACPSMVMSQIIALADQDLKGSVFNIAALAPQMLDSKGVNGWNSAVDQDKSGIIDDEEASAVLAAAFVVAAKHGVKVAEAPLDEVLSLLPKQLESVRNFSATCSDSPGDIFTKKDNGRGRD